MCLCGFRSHIPGVSLGAAQEHSTSASFELSSEILYIYAQRVLRFDHPSSSILPALPRASSFSQVTTYQIRESTFNMKFIASASLLGMIAAAGAQSLVERQTSTNATVA